MRVMLDATGLGSGAGGDETMLTGALCGLGEVARPGDEFVVVAAEGVELPAAIRSDRRFPVERVKRLPGAAHFSLTMPRLLASMQDRPELLFSPTHGPLWCPIPLALMVQDLSFEHRPQDYPPATRRRLQYAVRAQVRTARAILTVSEHARSDIVNTYRLDPERVLHVPNAALEPEPLDDARASAARRWIRSNGVSGRYLLYLGNLHPRKNVTTVISAFAEARRSSSDLDDVQLVIAGGRWWGSGEQEQAGSTAPDGSVVFLGRVDDDQREMLLSDAVALVYLSLFEGFGLPPLEAMSRGTPVIVSDRTSIPEVVSDAGIIVDPHDVEAASRAMRSITSDDGLALELAEKGRARASTYSVRATGTALRAAFATALSEPWERPLARRSAGAMVAVGWPPDPEVRSIDLRLDSRVEAVERVGMMCRTLGEGEVAVIRVSAAERGLRSWVSPLSAALLWRAVECRDSVVLGGWRDPDGAEVLVVRRLLDR